MSSGSTSDTPPGPEAVEDTGPRRTGPEVIARYLKTLPASPGVYRMLDAEGDVIYVGKARSVSRRACRTTRGSAGTPTA